MFKKIKRTIQTLAYVTPRQLFYRLKYLLSPVRSLDKKTFGQTNPNPIKCLPLPPSKRLIEINNSGIQVSVLNLTKSYDKSIEWNDYSFGQLWNYHLQYADFLKQDDLSVNEKENLLIDLYNWLISGKLNPEPYPASLRIMNVIRFLSENQKDIEYETELTDYLYSELHFLKHRPEYQLLGNHLMENAFALLMGGIYFNNEKWIHLAEEIFSEQIPEQILQDGGHIERSSMYHLILLFRILEALYYLSSEPELRSLFLETSKKMLGWMDQLSFRNGDMAHFNDSTDHQAYSKKQILEMARECGITEYRSSRLSNSGYRRFAEGNVELLIDACGIKPEYLPGHAHADSLSFILYHGSQPIIIDPGVSTYEANERRNWERSTKAHNTVTFQGQNTADVWGKFRVAKRPTVEILKESDSEWKLNLKHSLKSGEYFEHQRTFTCADDIIDISDTVNLKKPVEGRLHFHPNINVKELTRNKVILEDGIEIEFQNKFQIQKFTFEYSQAFNFRNKSIGISYKFEKNASLRITFPST